MFFARWPGACTTPRSIVNLVTFWPKSTWGSRWSDRAGISWISFALGMPGGLSNDPIFAPRRGGFPRYSGSMMVVVTVADVGYIAASPEGTLRWRVHGVNANAVG